jgi:hypothetical protein
MAGRFANQEALAEPQGWWKYAKHFVVPGFVNLFDGHCRLHLSVKLGGHVGAVRKVVGIGFGAFSG